MPHLRLHFNLVYENRTETLSIPCLPFFYKTKHFNHIKRADYKEADQNCFQDLTKVLKILWNMSNIFRKSYTVKQTVPGDVRFNSEVALALMKLDNKAVLHISGLQANFSVVYFLPRNSLEDLQHIFIHFCSPAYMGYLNVLGVGKRSMFTTLKIWVDFICFRNKT